MKPKLPILIGITGLLIICWVLQETSGYAQATGQEETRIARHVRLAKQRGVSSIEMPGVVPLYAEARSLDQALARYQTVLAQLEDQASVASPDGDQVWTWYKFKILADLSPDPLPQSASVPEGMSFSVPTALLPLKQNEVLVRGLGGAIHVEQVQVRMKSPSGWFLSDKKYLLFLNVSSLGQFQHRSRFGEVQLGPTGIFTVDSAGEIQPIINEHGASPIARDLRDKHGNSFQRLEQAVSRH